MNNDHIIGTLRNIFNNVLYIFRIGARLAQYSAAVSAWRQWESGLGALRSALLEDRDALEGLHGVLDGDSIHQVRSIS